MICDIISNTLGGVGTALLISLATLIYRRRILRFIRYGSAKIDAISSVPNLQIEVSHGDAFSKDKKPLTGIKICNHGAVPVSSMRIYCYTRRSSEDHTLYSLTIDRAHIVNKTIIVDKSSQSHTPTLLTCTDNIIYANDPGEEVGLFIEFVNPETSTIYRYRSYLISGDGDRIDTIDSLSIVNRRIPRNGISARNFFDAEWAIRHYDIDLAAG